MSGGLLTSNTRRHGSHTLASHETQTKVLFSEPQFPPLYNGMVIAASLYIWDD